MAVCALFPSMSRCGRILSSQRGTHQLAFEPSTSRAGASTSTIVAARSTATARPTPNCLTVGSPFRMKLPKTRDHDQRRGGDHRRAGARGRARRPRGRRRPAARWCSTGTAGTPGSPSRGRTGPRTSSAARSWRSGPSRRSVSTPKMQMPPAPLEARGQDAERGRDGEQVRDRRLQRDQQRAERDQQHEEAEREDGDDDQQQARGDLGGEVDVARRRAADEGLDVLRRVASGMT